MTTEAVREEKLYAVRYTGYSRTGTGRTAGKVVLWATDSEVAKAKAQTYVHLNCGDFIFVTLGAVREVSNIELARKIRGG